MMHTDLRPQNRKCLFTLHGHLDYMRTVQFHHEMPWIVCLYSQWFYALSTDNLTWLFKSYLPLMTRPFGSGTAPHANASPS